jgi:hypothetical protein
VLLTAQSSVATLSNKWMDYHAWALLLAALDESHQCIVSVHFITFRSDQNSSHSIGSGIAARLVDQFDHALAVRFAATALRCSHCLQAYCELLEFDRCKPPFLMDFMPASTSIFDPHAY